METIPKRDIWDQKLADHILETVKKYIPTLPEGTTVYKYSGMCMNAKEGRHSFVYLMSTGWNETFIVTLKIPGASIKLKTEAIYIPVKDITLPTPQYYPNEEVVYKRKYSDKKKARIKYVTAICWDWIQEKHGKPWLLRYQMSSNGHDTIEDEDVLRAKQESPTE
jgi:hypothetical protein